MKRSPTNEYLRTKVLTASPAELRLMLLDGAVRFAEQAQEGSVNKDYERMFEGVTRAQAILVELLNGLDPNHDAELCKRLSGLYTYMYTRLVAGSSTRDADIFDEVCKLLRYERETWQMLMSKLAGVQHGNAPRDGSASTPAQGSAADESSEGFGRATGQRLSVQG